MEYYIYIYATFLYLNSLISQWTHVVSISQYDMLQGI